MTKHARTGCIRKLKLEYEDNKASADLLDFTRFCVPESCFLLKNAFQLSTGHLWQTSACIIISSKMKVY